MSFWSKKVGEVARKEVVTLSPEKSVRDAATAMYSSGIGSVVITSPEGVVIGIFTERDLTRVVSQGVPYDTQLGAVMTRSPVVIKSSEPLSRAVELMAERNIRHLPVVDENNRVIGILTARDVVDLTQKYLASAAYSSE
ncbi:MAG: CBS domain-containing protein [Acidilobus sp.]